MTPSAARKHHIQTSETQAAMTKENALQELKKGNQRFTSGNMLHRDFALATKTTAALGQAPFAVILSCMDSRGAPEIIFDQGIGDIFSIRVAGNVLNQDNIASIEFAIKIIGAKVVVIMGHTQCGAVEAACQEVKFGRMTALLRKLQPAVDKFKKNPKNCSAKKVNQIAKLNVLHNIKAVLRQSKIIAKMYDTQQIIVVGAMHNLASGKVTFFNQARKMS